MYSGPRVLQVGIYVSDAPFRVSQGIIAGCAFATSLLRMILLPIMGQVITICRPVAGYLVVDDCALSCTGRI
eukprot:5671209-Pyramimonas_sp.AAC.1